MAISVKKLHPIIGAEVQGVDLSKPVDGETAAAIRRAFEDHVVLVFRDQQLDEQAQLAAAGLFGKVAMRRRPISGDGPGGSFDTPFMLVTNIVEDGKAIGVTAGRTLSSAREVGLLTVRSATGAPVYLRDVASVTQGPREDQARAWRWARGRTAARTARMRRRSRSVGGRRRG